MFGVVPLVGELRVRVGAEGGREVVARVVRLADLRGDHAESDVDLRLGRRRCTFLQRSSAALSFVCAGPKAALGVLLVEDLLHRLPERRHPRRPRGPREG